MAAFKILNVFEFSSYNSVENKKKPSVGIYDLSLYNYSRYESIKKITEPA
jgi:hypothetical protein